MSLENNYLNCLNSLNNQCNLLTKTECRNQTNGIYSCSLLEDGWCTDLITNNCVKSIPINNCLDTATNFCKNIQYEKSFCVSSSI